MLIASRFDRLRLPITLGLLTIASCDPGAVESQDVVEAAPPAAADEGGEVAAPAGPPPVEAAAESQRRMRINGFARALERERYNVALATDVAGDALVTIVEFSDPAAPDPTLQQTLDQLRAAHPDALRVVTATDAAQAEQLDVSRRPTLFVNGVALVGSELETLAQIVDAELETAKQLLALGARPDEVYPLLMRYAATKRSEPPAPAVIPWAPDFAGPALTSTIRPDGVLIEDLVVGEGETAAENTIISFEFSGYSGLTGKQVMGSRSKPAELVINQAARNRDPIDAAITESLIGMRVGGKRRVKVPANIVEVDKPETRPDIGDLWIAAELIAVRDAPALAPLDAFTGEPIASKRDDDGLEIVDYRAGEGPAASEGAVLFVHYVGQLADGTQFDTSHNRAVGLNVVLGTTQLIPGFARGLEGVRKGMLRKVVIPPELGYGDKAQGKIPAGATLVFYLEIMDVLSTP